MDICLRDGVRLSLGSLVAEIENNELDAPVKGIYAYSDEFSIQWMVAVNVALLF
jgi:hypothetical protein